MNLIYSRLTSKSQLKAYLLITTCITIYLFCFTGKSFAAVFVYEVQTNAGRVFTTVSKLPPDAFIFYNGGEDIVLRLKVLTIYADKDFQNALKDYNIEQNNSGMSPQVAPSSNKNIPRRPFYWWR